MRTLFGLKIKNKQPSEVTIQRRKAKSAREHFELTSEIHGYLRSIYEMEVEINRLLEIEQSLGYITKSSTPKNSVQRLNPETLNHECYEFYCSNTNIVCYADHGFGLEISIGSTPLLKDHYTKSQRNVFSIRDELGNPSKETFREWTLNTIVRPLRNDAKRAVLDTKRDLEEVKAKVAKRYSEARKS